MSTTNQSNVDLYQRIKTSIVTRAAEVFSYLSWDDTFAVKHIREIPAAYKKSEHYEPLDLDSLTADQAKSLGFKPWSEETPLLLIPLWIHPFLPDQVKLTSIEGDVYEGPKEGVDNDHRFGCLAYGIIPKE